MVWNQLTIILVLLTIISPAQVSRIISCPIKSPNCSCIVITGLTAESTSAGSEVKERQILNCNNIPVLPQLSPDPENLENLPLEIRLWNVKTIPGNAFNGVRRGEVRFSRAVELMGIQSFAFNNSRINMIRFDAVPNLIKIDNFAFTGWKSLAPTAFNCHKYLAYLDHCQMELRIQSIGTLRLGKLVFSGIEKLEHLYLASVEQEGASLMVEPEALEGMNKLKVLELNGRISGIEPILFGKLDELRNLRIRSNEMFEPKDFHFPFPHLQELELVSVDLSSTPSDFFATINKNLRKLSLSDCNLSSLPCSVERLVSLETLDISENSLDEFPRELWGLKHLKEITANGESFKNSFICNCSMHWLKAWTPYHTHGASIIANSEETPVFNCPSDPFRQGKESVASNTKLAIETPTAACTLRSCMRLLSAVCTEEYLEDPATCDGYKATNINRFQQMIVVVTLMVVDL